jgi:hypothetical protein
MSIFNHLAHVGFHECIGNIAHWVLRIHGLYIAPLCDEKYIAIQKKKKKGVSNERFSRDQIHLQA